MGGGPEENAEQYISAREVATILAGAGTFLPDACYVIWPRALTAYRGRCPHA